MSNSPLWAIGAALWYQVALSVGSNLAALVPCAYMSVCCFM